jgi:hypothetical protein
MQVEKALNSFWVLIGLLFVVSSSFGATPGDKSGLSVRVSGANLYAQQDAASALVAKLQSGEELVPLAEIVDKKFGIWFARGKV